MKLYTEEQVKSMLGRARIFDGDVGDNFVYILSNVEILSAEIPITLPSDEEIDKKFGKRITMYDLGYVDGAKWMRDKLTQKQNLSDIMNADDKDGLYEGGNK